MKRWYGPTGIATLLELTKELERTLALAVQPDQARQDKPLLRDDVGHLVTRVQYVLSQGAADSTA